MSVSEKNTKAEILAELKKVQEQINKNTSESSKEVKTKKRKYIKVANMTFGYFACSNDRVSIEMVRPLDIADIREDLFEDFFHDCKSSFENLAIMIIDDDVAEEYEMDKRYKSNNIVYKNFFNAINAEQKEMMTFLKSLSYRFKVVFVNEFIRQITLNNPNVKDTDKHFAIENHFKTEYGHDINLIQCAEQLPFLTNVLK